MPPFMFAAFRRAFVEATRFLNSAGISYVLNGGAALGFMKFQTLLPWDAGDIDYVVDVGSFKGGCDAWLRLLKAWADARGFKHPHVDPAGQKCAHYGVYAVPPATYTDDPYSMGLVTFSTRSYMSHHRPPPSFWPAGTATTAMRMYNVTTRVSPNLAAYLMDEYGNTALRHMTHANKNAECSVKQQFKHNCIGNSDGSEMFRGQCVDHTIYNRVEAYDTEHVLARDAVTAPKADVGEVLRKVLEMQERQTLEISRLRDSLRHTFN